MIKTYVTHLRIQFVESRNDTVLSDFDEIGTRLVHIVDCNVERLLVALLREAMRELAFPESVYALREVTDLAVVITYNSSTTSNAKRVVEYGSHCGRC